MRVIIMVNFTAGDRFLAFFARFTCHTPLLPYLHDSRINNYHRGETMPPVPIIFSQIRAKRNMDSKVIDR